MSLSNFINASGKSIILIIGVAFATEIAWRIYKKYGSSNKKDQHAIQTQKPIAETLFFSEQSALCRTHINFNVPCSMSTCPIIYLNKLVSYISSATRTLDVCIYFLTFGAVVKAIIELHKKDVIIRVITDDESSGNEMSQVLNLRRAGIRVRSRKSLYLMHHKFAIVDRKILISGSANWTLQAFFGNCENILITNQTEIVNSYMNEFEKLWLKFDCDYINTVQNGTIV